MDHGPAESPEAGDRRALWLSLAAGVVGLGLAFAAGLWLFGADEPEPPIKGVAEAVGSDRVRIRGVEIRLMGVDGPHRHEQCARDGVLFNCREAMLSTIEPWLRDPVTCVVEDHDDMGTPLAACGLLDGDDLGERMVRAGLAMAYRQQDARYVAAEAEAAGKKRGLWACGLIGPTRFEARKRGACP